MGKVGGMIVRAPNDADFVSIWTQWASMPSFQAQQLYCWSGIQDPTIGLVNGQPPGTTRWGAHGWGYLLILGGSSTIVAVEKFVIRASGIGALPSNIIGLPGMVQLSVSGILPQIAPF